MSQIEEIKQLHSQGDYEQAVIGYRDILQQDPNNDEAHFGMAHASSQLKQHAIALEHAKQAVNLAPNSDRYLQFLGQMCLANQKLDDALKAFRRSLKENPNLVFSYLALGDIYALKKESDKAKENYKLALKVDNDSVPAMIKMARLLMLEGDYESAQDELQAAELQFPSDLRIKLQMGIIKLEQQQDGFAEMYFKKLLEEEPNHLVAKTYLGISLINSDLEQAATIITDLINNQVQIPELMVAYGLLQAKRKQHRDAINYLAPVCQAGMVNPSWLLALAKSYAANQQAPEALTVLNEILERGEHAKALLIFGEIQLLKDDIPLALKTFKRIKATAPEFSLAQLRQAECLFKVEDYEGAVTEVDQLLAQQADHNGGIKLKLNALAQLEKYDEALALIASIDSNKQVNQFNQLMHFYAGLLLDAKHDYEKAWEHFIALEHSEPRQVQLLSSDEEKMVQAFTSEQGHSNIKFVFTDPATGHHDFLQWLLDNNITPLLDRFGNNPRSDVFFQDWTITSLSEVDETQAHLWRKKYRKQLNRLVADESEMVVDFLHFTPFNVAIIKKIFPQADVLVLSRNFADLRLHNRVFGSYQIHYTQMSKLVNQMITLNSKLKVVDIDAWQNKEERPMSDIQSIFGASVSDFKLMSGSALERVIFPFMHWKNYQKQLNQ